MKRCGRVIVILLSILMICATACGGGSNVVPTPTPSLTIHAPTVSYVPQGWYAPEYTEGFVNCVLDYSCTGCGMLLTSTSGSSTNGSGSVYIIYCPIPESYRVLYENDSALMKHELEFRWNASELTKAKQMTIDGQTALSVERCNYNTCLINVACIKDSTILDIVAFWYDPDRAADIMAVINSIKF